MPYKSFPLKGILITGDNAGFLHLPSDSTSENPQVIILMYSLPRCLKIWLWHSFVIPSLLLMAETADTTCDCIGVSYTVHELCCQIFAFCAKELCAPLDYWTKSCNFCLYQYLSLWGIFWFCFWTTFLLSVSRAFLSYLDKWSILNACFHFFYLLQLGGSHIPRTDVCTWIRSGVLWLSFWCVAFVAETLYLFQLCLVSQLDPELWRGRRGCLFPTLWKCAGAAAASVRWKAAGCILSS